LFNCANNALEAALFQLAYFRGGQTCSIEKSFAENQKQQRAVKSVLSIQIQFDKECKFYIKWPTSNRIDSLATNLTKLFKHTDKSNRY